MRRDEGAVVEEALPFAPRAPTCDSVSEVSGVVGWDVWVLKLGRSRDVKLGDGGSGVGGRL